MRKGPGIGEPVVVIWCALFGMVASAFAFGWTGFFCAAAAENILIVGICVNHWIRD
jgi:hypothetical protein